MRWLFFFFFFARYVLFLYFVLHVLGLRRSKFPAKNILKKHSSTAWKGFVENVCKQSGSISKNGVEIWTFAKVVRVPVLLVPVILASRTLGTGGTQSFQDWRGSVLSATQIPGGLARLSPFRPQDTLRTGGTQSFQPPTCPWDWRDSVLSAPQVSLGLAGLSHFSLSSTQGTGSARRTGTGESLT